jgi:5-hydroxyisourate hydrolase
MPADSTWPNQRLQIITSHLQPPHPPSTIMAAPIPKDPITCHVLDTTTGRPAAGINVTLRVLDAEKSGLEWTSKFDGITDADGRVLNWTITSKSDNQTKAAGSEIQNWIISDPDSKDTRRWSLSFETGAYYGAGKTFFPVVDLTFLVGNEKHYHVCIVFVFFRSIADFNRFPSCLDRIVLPHTEGVSL